jgi:7-cyano-7-deazaguanine synthase in queuosine biosynthesis
MSMSSRVLVRCDGAALHPKWHNQEWTAKHDIAAADFRGKSPNDQPISLVIQGLKNSVLEVRSPRTDDLIRIGAYVFRADQLVRRGGLKDAHGARWSREFHLCVPVIDLEFWADPEVQRRLSSALAYATEDTWRFYFSPASKDIRDQISWQQRFDSQFPVEGPESIVLFSGGLDSLSILLDARNRSERPMAVGHWSTTAIQSRQQRLIDQITQSPAEPRAVPLFGVRIHGSGSEPAERTRRTRGFLFACIGGAVAGELKVPRVYLGDNGPISLNLPINDQLTGAHVSRSTHPVFLDRINQLMALVYNAPIEFSNPLWNRTRGDCLEAIRDAGYEHLIRSTNSCGSWSRLPEATPQCGVCSQCIDRRFATIAAGFEAFDPGERYRTDVFRDDLPELSGQMLALSYVRFAQRVARATRDELLSAYPDIFDAILPDDPDPDGTLEAYLDLLHRHARSILTALETKLAESVPDMAQGLLLPTSLLAVVGFDRIAPAWTISAAPPAPEQWTSAIPETPAESSATMPILLSHGKQEFIFADGRWSATYENVTAKFGGNLGLLRIAHLLARPEAEFTAGELIATTDPASWSAAWSPDQATMEGMFPSNPYAGGTLGDDDMRKELRDAIVQCLRDIEDARDRHNPELEDQLQERLVTLNEHAGKAFGLTGKYRAFSSIGSKQQKAVYQSINRAFQQIDRKHPDLAKHLRQTITRSSTFSYRPDREMNWFVVLPRMAA